MSPRLPDFICIGAMRCGTTSLWALLENQPGVFLPARKELHYFDGFLDGWASGLPWYHAHFADCPPGHICGESTPAYLYIEEACARMRDVVPAAKLIAILRDPVERAWSHYWYEVCAGRERLSFRAALDAEPRRLARGTIEDRIFRSYFDRGLYADQLRRFADAFGRDALCVLTIDEVKRDPAAVLARVLRHVGAPGAPVPKEEQGRHSNKGWHPRSRLVNMAHRRALSWARRRPGTLPARVIEKLGRAVAGVNRLSGTPTISDADRAWLRDRYAESDARLAAWLGGAVPWRASGST